MKPRLATKSRSNKNGAIARVPLSRLSKKERHSLTHLPYLAKNIIYKHLSIKEIARLSQCSKKELEFVIDGKYLKPTSFSIKQTKNRNVQVEIIYMKKNGLESKIEIFWKSVGKNTVKLLHRYEHRYRQKKTTTRTTIPNVKATTVAYDFCNTFLKAPNPFLNTFEIHGWPGARIPDFSNYQSVKKCKNMNFTVEESVAINYIDNAVNQPFVRFVEENGLYAKFTRDTGPTHQYTSKIFESEKGRMISAHMGCVLVVVKTKAFVNMRPASLTIPWVEISTSAVNKFIKMWLAADDYDHLKKIRLNTESGKKWKKLFDGLETELFVDKYEKHEYNRADFEGTSCFDKKARVLTHRNGAELSVFPCRDRVILFVSKTKNGVKCLNENLTYTKCICEHMDPLSECLLRDDNRFLY